MNAILIVGEDEELRIRIRPHPRQHSHLSPTTFQRTSPFDIAEAVSWAGFSGQVRERARTGVTILNLTDPAALPLHEATRLPERYPGLRALFVVETVAALSDAARRRLTRPGIDILTRYADHAEFEYRLQRLLEMPTTSAPVTSLNDLMPELHDPRSGRLDARRLAEWFGLPLAVLARAMGREYKTVHRTPAGQALQDGLRTYLRIASALNRLIGSETAARVWLNAPNADLANETPRALMERSMDEAEVVAELLEDSLLGMPG